MTLNEIKSRLPVEFIDMLYEIYSPGVVDGILRSYRDGRKTTLRINTLKVSSNAVLEELWKNGIKASKCSFVNEALFVENTKESKISKLSCYENGSIYLQNLSSMLPPLFLNINENMSILDMCAAPGGKTTEIAAMIRNRGKIIANEINEIRRERLKYNVRKQGADCVEVIGEDGRKLGDLFKDTFDRVLLDAPCSGEGTIHIKNPKNYRKWSTGIIRKNSKLQKELLKSGINALKPGGILIYSTCTISPEENEEVIDGVIKENRNVKILDIDCRLRNSSRGLTVYKDRKFNDNINKSLRIIPGEEMEGFFLCKIKKLK